MGSSFQEFDLNILFKWNRNQCQIVKLGQDQKKKNFAYIMVKKADLSQSERKIVFYDHGITYVSPSKVYIDTQSEKWWLIQLNELYILDV